MNLALSIHFVCMYIIFRSAHMDFFLWLMPFIKKKWPIICHPIKQSTYNIITVFSLYLSKKTKITMDYNLIKQNKGSLRHLHITVDSLLRWSSQNILYLKFHIQKGVWASSTSFSMHLHSYPLVSVFKHAQLFHY